MFHIIIYIPALRPSISLRQDTMGATSTVVMPSGTAVPIPAPAPPAVPVPAGVGVGFPKPQAGDGGIDFTKENECFIFFCDKGDFLATRIRILEGKISTTIIRNQIMIF